MISSKLPLIIAVILAGLSFAKSGEAQDQTERIPPSFIRPIIPEQYLIRPGEQFTVTFLGTQLGSLNLTVDAEGRIVSSDLGIIDLSGKNFASAREILREALRKAYSVDDMAISIGGPVPLSVAVGGAVASPGRYSGYTSQTVSDIIDSAGGVLPNGSTRRIQFRGGETPLTVDLDRARYLNDRTADPNLYSGYDIYVPNRSDNLVEVVGAVGEPRQVELTDHETVADIISISGGLNAAADSGKIHMLSRPSEPLALSSPVKPGDVIVVPARSRNEDDLKITLTGAVVKAGEYDPHPGLTLAALLTQAGGGRQEANLNRIAIFRLEEPDAWGYSLGRRYPIIVDRGKEDLSRLELRPADSIFVPVRVGYVVLSGAAVRPGLYPYMDGESVDFYLTLAGLSEDSFKNFEIRMKDRVTSLTSIAGPGSSVADGDEIILSRKEGEK